VEVVIFASMERWREGKHAVPGFVLTMREATGAVFLRGESDFAHSSGGRARRVVHRGAEKLGKSSVVLTGRG